MVVLLKQPSEPAELLGSVQAAEMSRMPGRRLCEALDTGRTPADTFVWQLEEREFGEVLAE